MNIKKNATLANGVEMPCIGFGTYRMTEGEETVQAILQAIQMGYRHIDTASYYQNEKSVGEAVRRSALPREELFITSKVWNTDRGYEKTKRAFYASLDRLGLEYLDLYLIHWPANKKQYDDPEFINKTTWQALIDLHKEGRIRAIGVSNFLKHHLEPLCVMEIAPMVDQIEFHPGLCREETFQYCQEKGIQLEAWSPLGRGALLEEPCLTELAQKYERSAAQICLRWCLQNGVVPLPKSKTPSRMEENLQLFDFDIMPEDMQRINTMPCFAGSGHHPDEVEF